MKSYFSWLPGLLFAISLGGIIGCSTTAATNDDGDTTTDTLTIYGSDSGAPSELVRGLYSAENPTAGSPTSLNVNLYGLWVSPDADCTNPVLVQDNGDTPSTYNLADNPVIFSGTPDDGTYNCVILKMQDTMDFVADAEAVAAFPDACVDTTTTHVFDIYRDDSGDDNTWLDMDGNVIAATGMVGEPGTDTVYIFASMDPDAIAPTTASSPQIVTMTSALQVPGSATFIVSFEDQISQTTDETDNEFCWVEAPLMSFE